MNVAWRIGFLCCLCCCNLRAALGPVAGHMNFRVGNAARVTCRVRLSDEICTSRSGVKAGVVGCHPLAASTRAWTQRQDRPVRANAFSIDRRQHLDIAWKRQEEQEERALQLNSGLANRVVTEFNSLPELDSLIETAGPMLVVVFFYSKTCGICKEAKGRFQELAQDAKSQKARVAFLQHDVLDDYDHPSDVARFHKVKTVPCFLFLDDGAVVERVSLRDIRQMGGSKAVIQGAMSDDLRRLKHTFWRVLLRCAPSAK